MFINRLLNQGPTPLLEQMVNFTEKRARLLGDDIVNLSTPNYQQQDLSIDKFHALLTKSVEKREHAEPGDDAFDEVGVKVVSPSDNIQFHDRNNRSVEQLMSDQAQNALLHNMMIELMRRQFTDIQEALRERVS